MKHTWKIIGVVAIALLIVAVWALYPRQTAFAIAGGTLGGPPMTDSFTYQGYLEQAGQPANGYFDFDITIWDAETVGTEIASCTTLAHDNVFVQDGLFDFYLQPDVATSTVFNGAGRWLQVNVRPHGAAAWTSLPRQPITAAPYAWSLRPGASIQGPTSDPILSLTNTGAGSALYAAGQAAAQPVIFGVHSGDGAAIYGATGGAYPAVQGIHNADGIAVGGYALTGGYGVYGHNDTDGGIGVGGFQTTYSSGDTGLWRPGGMFGGRNGVIGISKFVGGYGVFGQNQSTAGDFSIGVYGESASSTGWAGYFWNGAGNGVYVSAASGKVGLSVARGTKNAVVATDEGSRLLYSEESTAVWFSDYGFGQLQDGVATIAIDPLFAKTVNLAEPYHVFVQVYGDAEVYVTDRTAQSFAVHLRDGDPQVEFSFRLVARRLGYEHDRLEPAPWADNDPNLYPEQGTGSGQQPGVQERQP